MDAPDPPVLNIIGQKIALGPLRSDLLATYQRWINDFAITRTLAAPMRPLTWEAEREWFERVTKSERDVVFTAYERETLRPVGSAGLHGIDAAHGTAEFGVMVGEKECWGRGYGTEITALTLDYGFHALGLHNIMLRVYSTNERGLRAYRRAGFREIGRRRQSVRIGGRRCDAIYMDCLASEFESPVLRRMVLGE
jgi:RimJ/RimL family protein N-acetyltransferase